MFIRLAKNKSASDFVDIGRLKDNIGNQNYEIPEETDLTKYATVLVGARRFLCYLEVQS